MWLCKKLDLFYVTLEANQDSKIQFLFPQIRKCFFFFLFFKKLDVLKKKLTMEVSF